MNTQKKRRPPNLLAILFLLFANGLSAAQPNDERKPIFSETHRFVFFAVLEGCYEDGLTKNAIDLIIPPDENGRGQLVVNFVYQCPLCCPAFDAFNNYASRQRFACAPKDMRNDPYNTFGPELEANVLRELAEPGLRCRNAIQTLIEKWISARIKRMRLTDEETKKLREQLAAMRKSGEDSLKRYQQGDHGPKLAKVYECWTSCPICSGASPMSNAKP